MKRVSFFLTALWLTVGALAAQGQASYTANFPDAANPRLKVTVGDADLRVVTHSGKGVIVEAKGYEAPPKRADGLRPLYSVGEDNTGVGMYSATDNGTLSLVQLSKSTDEIVVKVPANASVSVEQVNWQGDDISIEGIQGELEVKANSADIVMKNITGPVVASTTNGGVTIVFGSNLSSNPTSIKTVNGDIDITLPGSAKAEFRLNTMNGEIYSNLNIEVEGSSDMRRIGGSSIKGTLNGGGGRMDLSSINGEIFLRSK